MSRRPCEAWMLGYVAHWHETDNDIDENDVRQWLLDDTDHCVEDIDYFVGSEVLPFFDRKEEEALEKLRRSKATKVKIGTANQWIGMGEERIKSHVRYLVGRDIDVSAVSVDGSGSVWVQWIEPKGAA